MSASAWSAAGLVVAAALIVGLWQTTGAADAAAADRPGVGATPASAIGSAPDGGNDFVPAWSAWAWLSSPRVAPIDWGRVTSCLLQSTACVYIVAVWMDVCLIVKAGDTACITGYFD